MSAESYQSTTQVFLDIYDITNDLLLMKDGTASVIITVDAMNFGLLAEEEQDAVMYAYAGLLNSLNYPIQIVIRSQTKDVTAYLGKLKEQEDLADTRENRTRIGRYREFVSNLIRERNVLDKKFYVVVPATSIELGILPASSVIPGKQQFDFSSVEKSVILEKARSILEPKRDHIIGQFGRIGLYSRQLTTQEIIQLFYLSYNPEAADGQQLTDSRNYTTPLVSASIDEKATQTFNSVVATSAPIISQNSAAPEPAIVPLVTAEPVVDTSAIISATPVATQPVPRPPELQPVETQQPTPNPVTETIEQATPIQQPVVDTMSASEVITPAQQPLTHATLVQPTQLLAPDVELQTQQPSVPQQTPPAIAQQPKHFFVPPLNSAKPPAPETIFSASVNASSQNGSVPTAQPTAQPEQPLNINNPATIETVESSNLIAPTQSSSVPTAPDVEHANQQAQPIVPTQPLPEASKVAVATDEAQAVIDNLAQTVPAGTSQEEPLPPLPEIT